MNVSAIVSDMDGTLLNGQGKLSPYTIETVRMCTERGIPFIPCSGRTQYSLMPFISQLNTGYPYIGGNGSEIIGPDHVMWEQVTFTMEDALRLCEYYDHRGMHIQAYRGEYFYYSRDSKYSRRYAASSGLKGVQTGDLSACLNFLTPKFLVISEPEIIRQEIPRAAEMFADIATVTMSSPEFLELEPKGVSKADGLLRLSRRMGFDLENVLAFGDSQNDLSMLTAVGYGCAVENAREEVRSAVRLSCGPNTEDGPARFIRRNVLGEA